VSGFEFQVAKQAPWQALQTQPAEVEVETFLITITASWVCGCG
jgi:hypothetical protein